MIKTLCNLFFLCECVLCVCVNVCERMCVCGCFTCFCLVVVLVCWMRYEWVLDYFLSLMWSIYVICDFPYGISPLFSLNALNFLFIHINLLALNLHRIISFLQRIGVSFPFCFICCCLWIFAFNSNCVYLHCIWKSKSGENGIFVLRKTQNLNEFFLRRTCLTSAADKDIDSK